MGHLQVLPSTLEQMIYYLNTYCIYSILQGRILLTTFQGSYQKAPLLRFMIKKSIQNRNEVKRYVKKNAVAKTINCTRETQCSRCKIMNVIHQTRKRDVQ